VRQAVFWLRLCDLGRAADVVAASGEAMVDACRRDDSLLYALTHENLDAILGSECQLLPPDLMRAADIGAERDASSSA
jgi:hypothetical protein